MAHTPDLAHCLALAAGAARALEVWHERELVHGLISPDVFTMDGAGTMTVAAPLPDRSPELAYLAPEQTGRLAHGTDERTDLYAFGNVLYQLLTGRLPFDATDALEWAHCHLARQPAPPSELVPGLPGEIDDIVLRLLAKSPGARYQSASGLAADLERCLDELAQSGDVTRFELGTHDVSERFVLTGQMYGRERELATLEAALDRACRGGHAELLCLSGIAGVGKSAVLGALPRLVALRGGRMAGGKFDQYDTQVKHAMAAQLISQLVAQQLGEPEERLADWRERSRVALDANVGVLADIAPSLRLVVGDVPAPAAMPPLEVRNRLFLAVNAFLGTLTSPGQPLVLVLDDLQWADTASIELLEHLLTNTAAGGLLVVTAFRGKELAQNHPAAALLAQPDRRGVKSTTLKLAPLQRTALTALLADGLRMPASELGELAAVVAQKTGSNPLFVGEFLQQLRDDRLLLYDPVGPGWTWRIEEIRKSPVTENMVDFVAARIRLLAPDCLRLLELAAFLGDEFDVRTLSIVSGTPEAEVQATLRPAVYRSLLLPIAHGLSPLAGPGEPRHPAVYRWSHDRIRQAAVSIVGDTAAPELRLIIGRSLLAAADENERRERIFELVGHFNAARPLIVDDAERVTVAALNLEAGRRAVEEGLPAAAREYFAAGLSLLPADPWTSNYDLSFALHAAGAQAEHVAGEAEAADRLLIAAKAAAQGDVDVLESLRLQVVFMLDRLDLPGLLGPDGPGVEGLARIGIVLPWDPAARKDAADSAVAGIQDRLAELSADELFSAPRMTDPAKVAAARFLADLLPPATVDPDLLAVITSKGVELALENGLTGASSYSFALHSVVLAIRTGDDEAARECMDIAQRILHELPAPEFTAKTDSAVVLALAFWYERPGDALELLREGYLAGMAQGDVHWAIYNRMFRAGHLLVVGGSLEEIEAEINTGWRLLDQYSSINGNFYLRGLDDLVCRLTGRPSLALPTTPVESAINDIAMRGELVAYSASQVLVYRLTAAYMFGEYVDALRLAEVEESVSSASRGTPVATERYFYHALTLTALYRTGSPEQQSGWTRTLEELQAALDKYASLSPALFAARAMLVSAERARLDGRVEDAQGRYDQAIGLAVEHRIPHIEALAAELAGGHAHEIGQLVRAGYYIDRASDRYAAWGAAAKVEQLDYIRWVIGASAAAGAEAATVGLAGQLDLVAVLKASQAISGELDPDKLLATLLEVVVQHAGAERGCLVLADGGNLRLAATAEAVNQSVMVTTEPPGALDEQLPLALVRYTLRTRHFVVGGPADLPPLGADSYLDRWQPQSMLCAPLSRRGDTVAAIYLEHRDLAGTFTADHLSVFDVLCAQAAISLENAALYGDLSEATRVLDAAFDQLPSGLLLLHPDLTVRRASARFEAILGMPVPPGTSLQEIYDAVTPRQPDGRPLPLGSAAAATALNTGSVAHREVALPPRGERGQLLIDTWAIPLVDEMGETVAVAVMLSDITEQRHVEDELRHRALHDGLTGLPNRALFMDHLELALARLSRTERLAAVLFLDVDDFKLVNDTLGHSSGDLVLAELARRVSAAIRPQDTAARFGGDEFAVLCEDLRDEAEAVSVATRLRAAMSQPLTIEHVVRTTSVSVGIAIARAGIHSAHELLRDADTAMFHAKERGGNQHAIFNEAFRHGLLKRLEIEPALRAAVSEGQLVAHFQPKVALATGAINGAEALVRWDRPGHALVQPLDFIATAEDIGIVPEIDLWVFAEACRLVAGWRAEGVVQGAFTMATNLSAVTFNQHDLPVRLREILRETGAQAQDMCLEITETVLMADDGAARLMHPLKDIGLQLAIDDFGTGYSSLAYLRRFPVDVLKIDRSFVTGLATNSQDVAIARAVVALAHSLGLRSVAEGIESAEQLEALRALDCDDAQGFFFSSPVPADVLQRELVDKSTSPGRAT